MSAPVPAPEAAAEASAPVDSSKKDSGKADSGNDATVGTRDAGNHEPHEIATGRTAPFHIVSDGAFVYWTDSGATGGPDSGTILKCPVTGCGSSPTVLADNQSAPFDIVVQDGVVYWVNAGGGEVMKCAVAGCPGGPTPLATGQSSAEALAVSGQNLVWTIQIPKADSQPYGSDVLRCALPDCEGGPRIIASAQGSPEGIVLDGTTAFWANHGVALVPEPNGSVVRCDDIIAGCGPTPAVLVEFPAHSPRRIAVSASDVFWVNYDFSLDQHDGHVYKCARSGCDGTPIDFASGQAEPADIAVDEGFVYWVNDPANVDATGANKDAVLRCPLSGCGVDGPEVIARDQARPRGIAVDAKGVYWTSLGKGAIVSVAK